MLCDYVLCSEGGLTLATDNPVRLKRVNPSAKCLILSSGWWMPQSLEIGGRWGTETPLYVSLQERQWVYVKRAHWVNTIVV